MRSSESGGARKGASSLIPARSSWRRGSGFGARRDGVWVCGSGGWRRWGWWVHVHRFRVFIGSGSVWTGARFGLDGEGEGEGWRVGEWAVVVWCWCWCGMLLAACLWIEMWRSWW
ncbi:hypothetical protein EJ04DRAFT_101799 [Polyplosphaeria fusca]|uniref:Uncharacterized protein n=1 Tax=Polyplosphaeria fusca TaxID=682080 RepID=A0A9P4QNR7_9PLEO|nr:hypothetical protein EJ04DRAFT_101799 [Polyplosphaeria fusca]